MRESGAGDCDEERIEGVAVEHVMSHARRVPTPACAEASAGRLEPWNWESFVGIGNGSVGSLRLTHPTFVFELWSLRYALCAMRFST